MNITILQGAFLPVPPLLGGAVEKMWLRLGQEFVRAGHRVTQVSRAYPGLPQEEILKGVHHRRVSGFRQPSNGLILKALDFLYALKACRKVPFDSDIVVTNTFFAPLLLPGQLRLRAFVDIQRMPKGQCALYGQAARLRANSTPVADAIEREIGATRQERIVMIPNPLPFTPPAEVDFSTKKPSVLYCGRVHPEKGLDLLMGAAHTLPTGWSVDVVGPWETEAGGGGSVYLERLKRLAGKSPVTFHGAVFDVDRLNAFYRTASVFAYPSVAEQGETFGLAPLEAMAWGCVPVVSSLRCFQDFIAHERNGMVFDHRRPEAACDLARALTRLANDPDQRSALAAAGLKVRDTHAPAKIAGDFLSDFTEICSRHVAR